jgi:hypothetical protein
VEYMKWDFDKLEKSLNHSSDELKKEEKSFKELVIEISEKDESEETCDILFEVLSKEEKEYYRVNKAYQKYISQYSQAYIEMSEHYYGPELPYDVYCREFTNNKCNKGNNFNTKGTYLDSPQEIKELYALFMFFGIFEMYTKTGRHSQ